MRSSTWALSSSSFWATSVAARCRPPTKLSIQRLEAPAHINSLVTAIQPAVEATRGADVEATVKANIDNVVEGLRSSELVLKKEVETGAINVVGAYYNLDTATVSFTEKKKE
jgi:carbonic anhydrase